VTYNSMVLTHTITLLTHSLHGAGYYLKNWLSISLSKNILLSYRTQRFITMFTKARHWILSWATWTVALVKARALKTECMGKWIHSSDCSFYLKLLA